MLVGGMGKMKEQPDFETGDIVCFYYNPASRLAKASLNSMILSEFEVPEVLAAKGPLYLGISFRKGAIVEVMAQSRPSRMACAEMDASIHAATHAGVPYAVARAGEVNQAVDADLLLADDGFDSDVEIVSAQLCGVDVQGGHLAVEQAMNLCRAFRTALDPNYR